MKTRLTVTLFLIAATAAIAATLTITIPANDVPRVSKAFGALYQLGHDASTNEVAYYTQQWIINQVYLYERQQYAYQYTQPPLDMQPSPTPTATSTPTPTATPSATATPTSTP